MKCCNCNVTPDVTSGFTLDVTPGVTSSITSGVTVSIMLYFQSLKTSYGCVLVELKRIEEMSLAVTDSVDSSAVPSGGHFLDELFGHLCGQLCHFVMARSKVMELYPGQLVL